jgi:hypothetical protein
MLKMQYGDYKAIKEVYDHALKLTPTDRIDLVKWILSRTAIEVSPPAEPNGTVNLSPLGSWISTLKMRATPIYHEMQSM